MMIGVDVEAMDGHFHVHNLMSACAHYACIGRCVYAIRHFSRNMLIHRHGIHFSDRIFLPWAYFFVHAAYGYSERAERECKLVKQRYQPSHVWWFFFFTFHTADILFHFVPCLFALRVSAPHITASTLFLGEVIFVAWIKFAAIHHVGLNFKAIVAGRLVLLQGKPLDDPVGDGVLFSMTRFNEIYGLLPEFSWDEVKWAKLAGMACVPLLMHLSPTSVADHVALGAYVSEDWATTVLIPSCAGLFSICFPAVLYFCVLVEFF